MIFTAISNREGRLDMSDWSKAMLKKVAKENPGTRFKIEQLLPESSKQRGYFEGALIPLYMFFQENMDHRDTSQHDLAREQVKMAFNADLKLNPITGSIEKIAKSTKGRAVLKRVSEDLQDWLVEQYEVRPEILDPKNYKYWRDAIFPYGGPDNYIDYCVEKGILRDKTI